MNITNEDNMELMSRYEDNYFDLAIVDPPYGIDRGGQEVEYGPYSLNILKKAAAEGRINGKTLLFVSGMNSWEFLSDLPIYDDIFDDQKEDLSGDDRRKNKRKPFVDSWCCFFILVNLVPSG